MLIVTPSTAQGLQLYTREIHLGYVFDTVPLVALVIPDCGRQKLTTT